MGCKYCSCRFGWMSSETTAVCGNDECRRQSNTADWGRQPVLPQAKYSDGTNGARTREQKRLKTSGATHQSEHVIGYEVFGHGAKRGGSKFAKTIENRAP